MNRIEKVLKKLNVPYKKYGTRDGDALEVSFRDSTVTLSAFDDELQICTAVERETGDGMLVGFNGWMTYDSIITKILDCIVN